MFVRFEEYDKNKHSDLLKVWSEDKGSRKNSLGNYKYFGLLNYYKDINELIDRHPSIETDEEILKNFVIFNEENKDVAIVILDHVTYGKDGLTTLCVYFIIVRPDEQSKGYGPSIMDKVINDGEKLMGRRVDEIYASVDIANFPSSSMMEKNGFKQVCNNDNYNIYGLNLKKIREQEAEESEK